MRRARQAEPSCNRHLTERNHRRRYELHRLKIDSMGSSIDKKPPKRHPHLNPVRTRKARERKRNVKIKRENKLLLSKMANILNSNTFDNQNKNRKKSTFHEKRLKDMITITDQNQRLLSRLRKVKPTLNLKKMNADHRRNRKLLSNISLYGTNPLSPKQRVLTLSPTRVSSIRGGRSSRPVTAPVFSSRLSVKRTLFYTDTRVFGELVWDLNIWDVSGGVAMKKANHGLLKITASSTTSPHKCSVSLDLPTLRDIFRDSSPLVYKALTSDGASNKPIAIALGGPSSLLTMQLGLHLISGLELCKKKRKKKVKSANPEDLEDDVVGPRGYEIDLSGMLTKKMKKIDSKDVRVSNR
jgi:hypothetical protein